MSNTVIAGKPSNTIGDKDSTLVLRGSSVKIQWGNKFIDLVKNGKIASGGEKILKTADSIESVVTDGVYLIEDSIWVVIDGTKIQLVGESSTTYVSFLIDQKETTAEQKDRALTNIGFYYNTLEEAQNAGLTSGVIYVKGDNKLYFIKDGALSEYVSQGTSQSSDQAEESEESEENEEVINEVNYMGYQIPTLEELDDPNMVSLYHATPRDKINSIFAFGFDREFAKVMAYGEGVYTTPSVRESSTLLGSYGDTILQTKVIGGFDRFLMFEPNYARRYYGRNCSILDQLKTMLPEYQAIELYRRFGENVRSYSTVASEYKIRGAIYNWGSVVAVLPYDFSSIIPYAVSYDAGKTFQKKATEDTIDRFISSVDVTYRFGNKYKEINKAVAGLNFENKLTGYARVKKHNGKYNLVDIQTGEEISPIDFDSVTNMIPLSKDAEFSSDKVGTNAGDFDIEYHGHHFNACIYGFFLDKDEYMMNMGHTFDELPEIVE